MIIFVICFDLLLFRGNIENYIIHINSSDDDTSICVQLPQ